MPVLAKEKESMLVLELVLVPMGEQVLVLLLGLVHVSKLGKPNRRNASEKKRQMCRG